LFNNFVAFDVDDAVAVAAAVVSNTEIGK